MAEGSAPATRIQPKRHRVPDKLPVSSGYLAMRPTLGERPIREAAVCAVAKQASGTDWPSLPCGQSVPLAEGITAPAMRNIAWLGRAADVPQTDMRCVSRSRSLPKCS